MGLFFRGVEGKKVERKPVTSAEEITEEMEGRKLAALLFEEKLQGEGVKRILEGKNPRQIEVARKVFGLFVAQLDTFLAQYPDYTRFVVFPAERDKVRKAVLHQVKVAFLAGNFSNLERFVDSDDTKKVGVVGELQKLHSVFMTIAEKMNGVK